MANNSFFQMNKPSFGTSTPTYTLGGTTLTPSASLSNFNPTSLVADIAGLGGTAQQALTSAKAAIIQTGEARAQSLLSNVALLRGDVGRLRSVGEDVFASESRKAIQRTGAASAQFLASGVTLEGSAKAVVTDVQREGAKEALARQAEYEFQARRTSLQADIAERQAKLEREAARLEATSYVTAARAESKKSLAQYLVSNAAAMQQVSRQREESVTGGVGMKQEIVSAPDPISESIYQAALDLYRTL